MKLLSPPTEVCFLLLCSACQILLLTHTVYTKSLEWTQENRDGFPVDTRIKRSLFKFGLKNAILGFKAVVLLLKGATEVISASPNTRTFVKTGSYQKAMADFFSVKPTNVRSYTRPGGVAGKVGTVGDRTITVETQVDSSFGTLVIFNRHLKGDATQITYTDFKTYKSYRKLLDPAS